MLRPQFQYLPLIALEDSDSILMLTTAHPNPLISLALNSESVDRPFDLISVKQ